MHIYAQCRQLKPKSFLYHWYSRQSVSRRKCTKQRISVIWTWLIWICNIPWPNSTVQWAKIQMFRTLFCVATGDTNLDTETVEWWPRAACSGKFRSTRAACAHTFRTAVIVWHNRCGWSRGRHRRDHVGHRQNSENKGAPNAHAHRVKAMLLAATAAVKATEDMIIDSNDVILKALIQVQMAGR